MKQTIEYWENKLKNDHTVITLNELIDTNKILTQMSMNKVKSFIKCECQVCKIKNYPIKHKAEHHGVINTFIPGIKLDLCEQCYEKFGMKSNKN